MVPLLVIYLDGIVGGYVGINIHSDVNMFRYISQVLESITFLFFQLRSKHFLWLFYRNDGCYKGFNAENGTESVGKAANSAVVTASR
jgi:phospholipid/cholesterol/gamma-HCH transport system permease protein